MKSLLIALMLSAQAPTLEPTTPPQEYELTQTQEVVLGTVGLFIWSCLGVYVYHEIKNNKRLSGLSEKD